MNAKRKTSAVLTEGTKTVGLTGQSGAGKTMVSEIFAQRGFGVINCDQVARDVTAPMCECIFDLYQYFPECIDKKTMTLDRRALGKIVFADREKLELLNHTIFRYIRKEINWRIANMAPDLKYILLDAPTLFEAGMDERCDFVVSVTAAEEIRLRRVMERDGLDEESAKERFSSQHSTEFFEKNSDYVIRNDGSMEDVIRQTEEVIERIKGG